MERPTAGAQTPLPRSLLVWLAVQVPFNQMAMLICPPKSQIAGFTGHPDQCVLHGVLRSANALRRRLKWPHQPKQLRWHPVSLLHLGISPFCGQQRSVWKCGFDSPSAPLLRAAILSCSHRAIFSLFPYSVLANTWCVLPSLFYPL